MMTALLTLAAGTMMAADYTVEGQTVTIPVTQVKNNGPQVVCLQVVNDNIIRVRATSEKTLPQKPASLMIVPQPAPAKNSYQVSDEEGKVVVKTNRVKAVVSKESGRITFYDAEGKELLKEANDGKQFWDFMVPERELGMKTGYTDRKSVV